MKTTDKNIPITSHIGVDLLPEMHSNIYKLRIYGKMSYKKIGKMIGYSEDYCPQSVHRSKVKLKQLDKMLLDKPHSEDEKEEILSKWKYSRFEI